VSEYLLTIPPSSWLVGSMNKRQLVSELWDKPFCFVKIISILSIGLGEWLVLLEGCSSTQ
jgi:hypothetical protein